MFLLAICKHEKLKKNKNVHFENLPVPFKEKIHMGN